DGYCIVYPYWLFLYIEKLPLVAVVFVVVAAALFGVVVSVVVVFSLDLLILVSLLSEPIIPGICAYAYHCCRCVITTNATNAVIMTSEITITKLIIRDIYSKSTFHCSA